nr:hypothetical protein [Microcystis aeruginosa]
MRNVNLNILKFLEFIDNFCLSLSNIGLEVIIEETGYRRQDTVFSIQYSVFRSQESGVRSQETAFFSLLLTPALPALLYLLNRIW